MATAARHWAEVIVANDDFWREDRWWRRAIAVPSLLLLGDGGLGEWFEHRTEQRWARRVLRAGRGHTEQRGTGHVL